MATQITKFQDNNGNLFDTEAEADASNTAFTYTEEVTAFVKDLFPIKEGSKHNAHASTAKKAIMAWLGRKTEVVAPDAE